MAISEIVSDGYIEVTGFDGNDWSYTTATGNKTPLAVKGMKLIPADAGEKAILKKEALNTPVVGACYASDDAEPRVDANFGKPFLPLIDGTLSNLSENSIVVLYGDF